VRTKETHAKEPDTEEGGSNDLSYGGIERNATNEGKAAKTDKEAGKNSRPKEFQCFHYDRIIGSLAAKGKEKVERRHQDRGGFANDFEAKKNGCTTASVYWFS